MLLLYGEEVLVGLTVGKHDSLAAQCANLSTANVKDVTMACQVGQRNIAVVGHQAIAQPGAVDIQRNVVALTDLIDVVQFAGSIKCTKFGWESDVDQSRMHGMVAVAVVAEIVQILVEPLGGHLAHHVGNSDNFVLGKLDGPRLMDIDMAGANTDDAFVLIEHGVDGGGIGLRTTRQKEYLCIGHANGLTDKLLGTFRELVEPVRRRFGIVVAYQILEHLRMGTVVIVAFK